jgi:hypothetical protein
MTSSRFRFITACFCLALLPLCIVAEDAKAILNISGTVTVNGKPAQDGTPIFDGDRIDVGPDSSAGITAKGSMVTLDANSSLVYRSGNISFGCGSATISSMGIPTTAVINGIEVSFGSQPGKVQLTDKDGVLLIKSLTGTAEVKEATGTSSLSEGFSLARPGSANCATPVTIPTSETKPTAKPHSNTTLILVGVGAAAAAGVGIAAGAGGKGNDNNTGPISPSRP